MSYRKYQELFTGTARFTDSTRACLERSVGRALFGKRSDPAVLRSAVARATRELLAQGLDATATLAALGALVENGGRACRADRTSLITGEPSWMALRTRVLESARDELAVAMV